MAPSRDVGEEDAHLAVFHPSGAPAILRSNAGRVAPAFGEAAFIEHQDWERHWLLFLRGVTGEQGLADQGTHLIAHRVLIPDGAGEQALHAIRVSLSGLFSELPAIFARPV